MEARLPLEVVQAVIGCIAALPNDDIDAEAAAFARSSIFACSLINRRWSSLATQALATTLIVVRDHGELDRIGDAASRAHFDFDLVRVITVGDYDVSNDVFDEEYDRLVADRGSGYDSNGEALLGGSNVQASHASAVDEAFDIIASSQQIQQRGDGFAARLFNLTRRFKHLETIRLESARALFTRTSYWAWPAVRLIVGRLDGDPAHPRWLEQLCSPYDDIYEDVQETTIHSLTVLDPRYHDGPATHDFVAVAGLRHLSSLDLGRHHSLNLVRPLFSTHPMSLTRLAIGLDRYVTTSDDANDTCTQGDAFDVIARSSCTTTILFGHGAQATPRLETLRLYHLVVDGEQAEDLLSGVPGSLRSLAVRIDGVGPLARIDTALGRSEVAPNLVKLSVDVMCAPGVAAAEASVLVETMTCCRNRGVEVDIQIVED